MALFMANLASRGVQRDSSHMNNLVQHDTLNGKTDSRPNQENRIF